MKRISVGLLAVAFACVLAFGCEKAEVTEDMTATAEGGAAMQLPEGTAMPEKAVSAATVVIGDLDWTVEVATTDEERMKGLGGRESLAQDTGMWFVFPDDSSDPFWMKDTNFDLDIIFVGNDKKVVDVKLGNKKLTEDLIQPAASYRYVLEVPAGEGSNVQVGDTVDYRIGPK